MNLSIKGLGVTTGDLINEGFNITITTQQQMVEVCNHMTGSLHGLKDFIGANIKFMIALNIILFGLVVYEYYKYNKEIK